MSFRFRNEVRGFVKNLAELMMFANRERDIAWSAQTAGRDDNGVFGFAYDALEKIIAIECGSSVLDAIRHSRYGFNWGGNSTPLDDVEAAVQEAQEAL